MYPRHVQIHTYHLMYSWQACSLSYLPAVFFWDADNGSIAILDPMQVLFFATSVRLKNKTKNTCAKKRKENCAPMAFFGAINRLSVIISIVFWLVKRMKKSFTRYQRACLQHVPTLRCPSHRHTHWAHQSLTAWWQGKEQFYHGSQI